MLSYLKRNKDLIPVFLFFAGVSSWWAYLTATKADDDHSLLVFAAVYGLITLYGGVLGIFYSRKWGFLKSTLGKALFFLSLSLFLTELGQLTFSYYNIFAEIEIPYPSLADVGFFGAVPMYILGAFFISKTLNVKYSLKGAFWKKVLMALIPIIMIGSTALLYSYYSDAADSGWLVRGLDYGYPIGQAITVSIVLITIFNSSKALGGIMRPKMLLLLGALILQYIADLNFLIQGFQDSWINGRYGDYLYFVAYTVMVVALLSFKVRNPAPVKEEVQQ